MTRLFVLLVFMSAGIVSLPVWGATQQPLRLALDPIALSFKLQSFEGDWTHPCKAELQNPENPYDFRVRCYEGTALVRTLDVHLAISIYRKSSPPMTSIELLYWVNGEGATSWVHLEDRTNLKVIESSQSLTGEPVTLRLKATLP